MISTQVHLIHCLGSKIMKISLQVLSFTDYKKTSLTFLQHKFNMFERLLFQAYKYQQGDVFSIRPFMQGFQAFPRNISKAAKID